jgi:energy-coupling factor transporter ATP-binding protein EcfA2
MWRERGLTMVLVTHDSTVARRAQRIGVMKNGRLTFKASSRAKASRVAAVEAGAAGTGAGRSDSPGPSGFRPPGLSGRPDLTEALLEEEDLLE